MHKTTPGLKLNEQKLVDEQKKGCFCYKRKVEFVPTTIGIGSVGLGVAAYVFNNPILATFGIIGGSFLLFKRLVASSAQVEDTIDLSEDKSKNIISNNSNVIVDKKTEALNNLFDRSVAIIHKVFNDTESRFTQNAKTISKALEGLLESYTRFNEAQKVTIIQVAVKLLSHDVINHFANAAFPAIQNLINNHLQNDMAKTQLFFNEFAQYINTVAPKIDWSLNFDRLVKSFENPDLADYTHYDTVYRYQNLKKMLLLVSSAFNDEKIQGIDFTQLNRSLIGLLEKISDQDTKDVCSEFKNFVIYFKSMHPAKI